MPKIRALNTQIPAIVVRMPKAPYRIEIRQPLLTGMKDLKANHRLHHPNEKLLPLRWKLTGSGEAKLVTNFYGKEVILHPLTTLPQDFIGHLLEASDYKRESDIATIVLEQTFGSEEDPLTLGRKPNRDGYIRPIAWDQEHDCIIASSQDGYRICLEGTNLVEAAIYLPNIYNQLKTASPAEGIAYFAIRSDGQHETIL